MEREEEPTITEWCWRLHDGLDAMEQDCLGRSAISSLSTDPNLVLRSAEFSWLLKHFASRRDRPSLLRVLEAGISCSGRLFCAAVASEAHVPNADPLRPRLGIVLAEHLRYALENSLAQTEEDDDVEDEEDGEECDDDELDDGVDIDEIGVDVESPDRGEDEDEEVCVDMDLESTPTTETAQSRTVNQRRKGSSSGNAAGSSGRTRTAKKEVGEVPPQPSTSRRLWRETLYDEKVAAAFRSVFEQACAVGEVKPSEKLLWVLYDPTDSPSWLEDGRDSSALSKLCSSVLPENAFVVQRLLRNSEEANVDSDERRHNHRRRAITAQVLQGFWRSYVWPRSEANDAILYYSFVSGQLKNKTRLLDEALREIWERASVETSGSELERSREFWTEVFESCVTGNCCLASRLAAHCRASKTASEFGNNPFERPVFEWTLLRASERRREQSEGETSQLIGLALHYPVWMSASTHPELERALDRAFLPNRAKDHIKVLAKLLAIGAEALSWVLTGGAKDKPNRVRSLALDAAFAGKSGKTMMLVLRMAAREVEGKKQDEEPRSATVRSMAVRFLENLAVAGYPGLGRLAAKAFGSSRCNFLDLTKRIQDDALEPALATALSRHLATITDSSEATKLVMLAGRIRDPTSVSRVLSAIPWDKTFLPCSTGRNPVKMVDRVVACARLSFLLICLAADMSTPDAEVYFDAVLPAVVAPLRESLANSDVPNWDVATLCHAMSDGLIHNEDWDDWGSEGRAAVFESFLQELVDYDSDSDSDDDETSDGRDESPGLDDLTTHSSSPGAPTGSEDRSDPSSPRSPNPEEQQNPTGKHKKITWRYLVERMSVDFSELLANHFGQGFELARRRRNALDVAFGPSFAERFAVISAVYMALPQNGEAQNYSLVDEDGSDHLLSEEERERSATPDVSLDQDGKTSRVRFWEYWAQTTMPCVEDDEIEQSAIQKLVWRPIVSRILRINFGQAVFQGGETRRNHSSPFDSIPPEEEGRLGDSGTSWIDRCAREIEKATSALDREEAGVGSVSTEEKEFQEETLHRVEPTAGNLRPWRKNLERFFPKLRKSRTNFFGSYRLGNRLSWRAMLRLAYPRLVGTSDELLWPIELVANGWDPAELLEDGIQETDDDDEETEIHTPDGSCREAVAFVSEFSQSLNWCDANNSPSVKAMWQDSEMGPFGYCPLGALCAIAPSNKFQGWIRAYPIVKNLARVFAFFARRAAGSSWLSKLSEDFVGSKVTSSPEHIDRLAQIASKKIENDDNNTTTKELDFLRARRIVAGLVVRKDKFLLPMISDSNRCALSSLPFSDPTCANCQEPLAVGDVVAFYDCNHAVHVNCLCDEIRSKSQTDPTNLDSDCRCAYRCETSLDFSRKHVRLT